MKRVYPDFLVFTSPIIDENEEQNNSCYIAIEGEKLDVTEFADHLDANSLLKVKGFYKLHNFFWTYGNMYHCTIFDVCLKDTANALRLELEQIAIAETYTYLQRLDLRNE